MSLMYYLEKPTVNKILISDDTITRFTKNIRFLTANIKLGSQKIDDSFAILNEIEQLILSDMLTPEEEIAFISSPENISIINNCRKLNIIVDGLIEKQLSDCIINKSLIEDFKTCANPIYQSYLERFESIANCESKIISKYKNDNIIFIGSGQFPISAINYFRKLKSNITIVEQNEELAKKSEIVLSNLGYLDKIKVINSKGQDLLFDNFDIVVVGVLAVPKEKIINSILSSAKPNTKIIMRTTYGCRTLLCEPLNFEEVSGLKLIESYIARGNQTLSTLLFSITKTKLPYDNI